MSAGGGYNDWETDLSSIIEKTNQNLKLLRRIGDKRSDISSYDISMTAPLPASSSTRPATSAAQIASDMRSFASSISSRYAAEDAATRSHHRASTTGIPRSSSSVTASASTTRKLHRSSSVGVDAREKARESLIIRPAAPTNAFGLSSDLDGDVESDARSPRGRPSAGTRITSTTKARASLSSGKTKPSSRSSAAASTAQMMGGGSTGPFPIGSGDGEYGSSLDELRKSLEVHIASRSGAFEKALGDLRTDMTVVTTETSGLNLKIHDLKDAVMAKLSNVAAAAQSIAEQNESIGRLEKHSAVLLGWKVGVDQDLFELSSKIKAFASIQDKMSSLEGHLESLGSAIKTAQRTARHDEKIDELKDRMATLERQLAHQMDAKAIEHTVQMRVAKEINELENRMNQSLAFLTQKLEGKLQSVEKTVQSDRIEAIASVKSELVEDMDKLDAKTAKKQDLVPFQNAQAQVKEDVAHMQLFFERQDKRFQEMKQNSAQIRDELVETRHELTKALHAQQSRVSSTLEEKVAHLVVASKDKNAKVEQKVALLEKRSKKAEELTKTLQDTVAKLKKELMSRQAGETVSQQRESEKLRQGLAKSIAELEQVHAAKQDVERAYETQERQYQAKLKELRAQLDEQERLKESQRAELLQSIQQESKQMGVAQGRQAVLESLLAREKAANEEKAKQIHQSRQEITLVRQKMRGLEAEVDKKLLKLSTEVQAKQSQVEALAKKLKRSEEDVAKTAEAGQREKKLLLRTKELKQQELNVFKLKLKEAEKVAASPRPQVPSPVKDRVQVDERGTMLADVERQRKELEELLVERQVELQSMKTELTAMASERDAMVKAQSEAASVIREELQAKIVELEQRMQAKDAQMLQLCASLIDKSELEELAQLLEVVRCEKEALVAQLAAQGSSHEQHTVELRASIESLHQTEKEELQSKLTQRIKELTAVEAALAESQQRIHQLESEAKASATSHHLELARVAEELKVACSEKDQLMAEISGLEAAKRGVEGSLRDLQAQLELAAEEEDARAEELEELRASVEELNAERQRLHDELKEKAAELDHTARQEEQQRQRITSILEEQDELRSRYEGELQSVRDVLKSERETSAERLQELQTAMEVLQVELSVAKQQNEQAVGTKSSLESTVSELLAKLAVAAQTESQVTARLDAVVKQIVLLGHADRDECVQDPAEALAKSVNDVTAQCARQVDTLRLEHELALQQAATERKRVEDLETRIHELEALVDSEERACSELKSDLAKVSADKATALLEIGHLQDEVAELQDAKHTLVIELDESIAKIEELEASSSSQLKEKEAQAQELREANSSLAASIAEAQATMDRIEAQKARDLDQLSIDLQDLEAQLSAWNERRSDDSVERDYFASQQQIATLGQNIRALHTKLASGCSISEWHAVKAALEALEQKQERQIQQLERDRRTCTQAEDEVLLNVEFLEALVHDSSQSGRHTLASKYVQVAPALVAKLTRLQDQVNAAVRECAEDAAARLTSDLKTQWTESAVKISQDDDPEDAEEDEELASDGEELEESNREDEEALDQSTELSLEPRSPLQIADSEDEGQSALDDEEDAISDAEDVVSDGGVHSEDGQALDVDACLDVDGDEVMIDACTTLLHSPTTTLLEESFQPDRFQRRELSGTSTSPVVLATAATFDHEDHDLEASESDDGGSDTVPAESPLRSFVMGRDESECSIVADNRVAIAKDDAMDMGNGASELSPTQSPSPPVDASKQSDAEVASYSIHKAMRSAQRDADESVAAEAQVDRSVDGEAEDVEEAEQHDFDDDEEDELENSSPPLSGTTTSHRSEPPYSMSDLGAVDVDHDEHDRDVTSQSADYGRDIQSDHHHEDAQLQRGGVHVDKVDDEEDEDELIDSASESSEEMEQSADASIDEDDGEDHDQSLSQSMEDLVRAHASEDSEIAVHDDGENRGVPTEDGVEICDEDNVVNGADAIDSKLMESTDADEELPSNECVHVALDDGFHEDCDEEDDNSDRHDSEDELDQPSSEQRDSRAMQQPIPVEETRTVPLLALDRLAALRRESDEDEDGLMSAQLSMDNRRRALADDDDEFDDLDGPSQHEAMLDDSSKQPSVESDSEQELRLAAVRPSGHSDLESKQHVSGVLGGQGAVSIDNSMSPRADDDDEEEDELSSPVHSTHAESSIDESDHDVDQAASDVDESCEQESHDLSDRPGDMLKRTDLDGLGPSLKLVSPPPVPAHQHGDDERDEGDEVNDVHPRSHLVAGASDEDETQSRAIAEPEASSGFTADNASDVEDSESETDDERGEDSVTKSIEDIIDDARSAKSTGSLEEEDTIDANEAEAEDKMDAEDLDSEEPHSLLSTILVDATDFGDPEGEGEHDGDEEPTTVLSESQGLRAAHLDDAEWSEDDALDVEPIDQFDDDQAPASTSELQANAARDAEENDENDHHQLDDDDHIDDIDDSENDEPISHDLKEDSHAPPSPKLGTATDESSPNDFVMSERDAESHHPQPFSEYNDAEASIDGGISEIDEEDASGAELSEVEGSEDFDNVQLDWGESTGDGATAQVGADSEEVRFEVSSQPPTFNEDTAKLPRNEEDPRLETLQPALSLDESADEAELPHVSDDASETRDEMTREEERRPVPTEEQPSKPNFDEIVAHREEKASDKIQARRDDHESTHEDNASDVEESNDFDSIQIPWDEREDSTDPVLPPEGSNHQPTESSPVERQALPVPDRESSGDPSDEGPNDLSDQISRDQGATEDDDFGDDELDEIEKLVRVHADKAYVETDEVPPVFSSSLRMEDDEDDAEIDGEARSDSDGDELIDSTSEDEEEVGQSTEDGATATLGIPTPHAEAQQIEAESSSDDDDDEEEANTRTRVPPSQFDTGLQGLSSKTSVQFQQDDKPAPRSMAADFDDDSDDDEEEAIASQPTPQPYQLPQRAGQVRTIGGGSLMKALSVSRSATRDAEDDDDDLDEVEKLMAAQSSQRRPITSTPTLPSSQATAAHPSLDDEQAEDSEDKVQPSATMVDASKNSVNESESDAAEEDDENESFADDDFDRVMASPQKPSMPSKAMKSFDSDDDDDDEGDSREPPSQPRSLAPLASTTGSGFIMGKRRPVGGLNALPALSKKPALGLGGSLGRHAFNDDDDDDMDEIERLLQEQTSMKSTRPTPSAAVARNHTAVDEDEDEFDLAISASASTAVSPTRDLPLVQDDDEFAHFDRDDGDEDENEDDKHLSSSQDTGLSPTKPVASATSPVKKATRKLSERSEDDGADAYLSESFDLEESLQEEEDEEVSTG